jgi:type VI protein secretion system component Hcp
MLIYFDGVEGESTMANHGGWLEIMSLSEGMTSPSSAAFGTGSSGGKTTLMDTSFVIQEGKHTTEIIKKGTNGQHFAEVKIHYLKNTGAAEPEVYRECILKEVYITAWTSSKSTDTLAIESFSMSAAEAKWEYFAQNESGQLTSTGDVTYNQKTAVTA